MKSTLFILTIALLTSFNSFGQHKVEYNFLTKDAPIITPAEIGTNSIFKINNINKFLYEVKIESSQSEFNSTPPTIFSTIFNFEKKEESSAKTEANKVIENSSETENKKSSAIAFGIEKAKLFRNEQKLLSFKEDLNELTELPDSLKENSKITKLNETIKECKIRFKLTTLAG